ncbi:MAG: hypothetical protein V4582_00485 [Pseudomonadota bacterium]
MNNRRKLFTGLAAGAALLPAMAVAAVTPKKTSSGTTDGANAPTQARGGDAFPNILVTDQSGKKFRLHEQMLRDQLVMVNFISIAGHDTFAATAHMANIADRLGPGLGRDVAFYTISTDPADTPARMQELARKYGAVREGWHFITASTADVNALSKRLYKAHAGHEHHGAQGHSMRLVHYGNVKAGVWGAFGADSEPGFAAERVTWMQGASRVASGVQRAGPRLLADSARGHNRMA